MPTTGRNAVAMLSTAPAVSGTAAEKAQLQERFFYAGLLAIIIFRSWILRMNASLWLDETGTWWVIRDGLREAASRAVFWSQQSPLYYVLAWCGVRLGGSSEIVLRLPSLIAMLAGTFALYRLGVRLFDARAGLLAAVLFATCERVAFAAIDARPYALTLFFIISAGLFYTRWLESRFIRDAAAFALASALAIYAHSLSGLAVAALFLHAFVQARRERSRLLGTALTALATLSLSLPVAYQALQAIARRSELSFTDTPSLRNLFEAMAPPEWVGPVVLGALLAYSTGHTLTGKKEFSRPAITILMGWATIPPLSCFVISVVTDAKLFVPRYFISAMPALALLGGWALSCIADRKARLLIVLPLALAAVIGGMGHDAQDWRAACARIRTEVHDPSTPVLAASGFIEAARPERLKDQRYREILFAPLLYYKQAGRIVPLPFPAALPEASLEQTIRTELAGVPRFLLVSSWGPAYEIWFRGRLPCYRARTAGDFGGISVVVFERRNGSQCTP